MKRIAPAALVLVLAACTAQTPTPAGVQRTWTSQPQIPVTAPTEEVQEEPPVPLLVLTPTDFVGDQSTIDTGVLTTWWDGQDSLPCLLAGHDIDGWDWLDEVAPGTVVQVTQGPCAGDWIITENRWEPRSPSAYPWMYELTGWLLLQTCSRGGYGFSVARPL